MKDLKALRYGSYARSSNHLGDLVVDGVGFNSNIRSEMEKAKKR